MRYSEELLKRIRELNHELDQYAEPANAQEAAKRELLLEALAWYVHKLQMRVLPVSGDSGFNSWDPAANAANAETTRQISA